MRDSWKLAALAALAIGLIALFMTIDGSGNWDYILPRRAKKIAAIILTGAAISISTVVFQTLTNNKILTPTLMGLDSMYLLLQTAIVFLFGSTVLTSMAKNVQFALAVGLMMLFAGVLYKLLFKREGNHLYFLLLVGIICGTFFSSIASFMQMLLDPNDFMVVQDKMFASFNNMNTDVLIVSVVLVLLVLLIFYRDFKYLDVMALGKEHSVNLGVPHDRITKRLLVAVALLVAVSTALVGPVTFLGLLVSNVAYRLLSTFRHQVVIAGTVLISIVALVGGQLIVERVFTFSTTLSVILNFIGGIYFLYLLLKESKAT
ncbi:iron ABC transporter permease [Cohnella sp. CIP 111063]|uniref:iron chelate uptake ABC transporter family permease subunit n=1 Tax=unclassified Cohnella TaxID=2636738 RepID=UPI000B8C6BC5|nr:MULTISPECIES: iron chelate uptake ABC transporter family permease subunit [unclassified Cohnella]OXS59927.1 iron ABC transporter permease [Cohnella sp. CIP 111063]PRX72736.1 iron complex transport system permease protein [Cohnella sp. SGD-V74]